MVDLGNLGCIKHVWAGFQDKITSLPKILLFALIFLISGFAQAGFEDAIKKFGEAVEQIQQGSQRNGNNYQRRNCPRGSYLGRNNYCVPENRTQCELDPSKSCPIEKICAEFNGVIGCYTQSELYAKKNAILKRQSERKLLNQQKHKEEQLRKELNNKDKEISRLRAEIRRLEEEGRLEQQNKEQIKLQVKKSQQKLDEAIDRVENRELMLYALAGVLILISIGGLYSVKKKSGGGNSRTSKSEEADDVVDMDQNEETLNDNENTHEAIPKKQVCSSCGHENTGSGNYCLECGESLTTATHYKNMAFNAIESIGNKIDVSQISNSAKKISGAFARKSNGDSKILRLLGNVAIFVSFYLILMIPTYILPYYGSNSAVLGTLALGTGVGINPAFWMHLGVLLTLIAIAWFRGVLIDKKWLIIFPILATAFDMFPGLSSIPLVPTVMHICTIIIGVVKANATPITTETSSPIASTEPDQEVDAELETGINTDADIDSNKA